MRAGYKATGSFGLFQDGERDKRESDCNGQADSSELNAEPPECVVWDNISKSASICLSDCVYTYIARSSADRPTDRQHLQTSSEQGGTILKDTHWLPFVVLLSHQVTVAPVLFSLIFPRH